MSTLQELLKEFGLEGESATQEKTAAANQQDEVSTVLQSLGLDEANDGIDKVASENENKGERMSLTGIYEQIFEDQTQQVPEGTEKVASEEVNEATSLFGELTAHYFGAAQGAFLSKVAASVEDEVDDANEAPMKHLGNNSQLTNSMGKPGEPGMPVNHSASGGAPLKTMTGNTSPYSLKEMALKKAVLKRLQVGHVGNFKD
jgi:hypothetical protein